MKFTESKTLECGTAADELVSYLYGEASEDVRTQFEQHLLECDTCTSEFASLSLARLEVYEWHRDEFAEMPTPRFEVPYDQPMASGSWLGGISGIFNWNGGLAAGGLAAATLAVMIGAWFVFYSAPNGIGVAKIDNSNRPSVEQDEIRQPVSLPDPERPDNAEEIPESLPEKPIKVSAPSRPTPAKFSRPSALKESKARKAHPASEQAQQRNAPRLNGSEDETDRTLRLADLLAEIDTDD